MKMQIASLVASGLGTWLAVFLFQESERKAVEKKEFALAETFEHQGLFVGLLGGLGLALGILSLLNKRK